MTFGLTPSCKTALSVLVSFVSITAALLAVAVIGIDTRIAQALVPVTTSITQLQERQQAQIEAWRAFKEDTMRVIEANKAQAREDNARVEKGVQDGFETVDKKVDLILRTLGK